MKFPQPIYFCLIAALCGFASTVHAEEKTLPPAVEVKIDFARDIQPILENSCLRCHGPLKTKSHFRLDNRELAIAGGDKNKNDVIPGDSAHSLLIQYTAYAVEDMEMPPDGKGDRLTAQQVGLL